MLLSFQTPPPRDRNDGPRGMAAARKDDEGKIEWPVDGGRPPVRPCLPRYPQEEEEKKQTAASEAGSDRRRGDEEEEGDDKTERSGESEPPEAGDAPGFAAGAPAVVEPGEERRRLNSQQTGRLSAAAAAIEAAAAAVAAIPVVGFCPRVLAACARTPRVGKRASLPLGCLYSKRHFLFRGRLFFSLFTADVGSVDRPSQQPGMKKTCKRPGLFIELYFAPMMWRLWPVSALHVAIFHVPYMPLCMA